MEKARARIYEFGDFRVDANSRLLLRDNGEPEPLTPKVFDTLLYLVERAGEIIDKNELMREIWSDTIVEENNLNKNISVLRRVLGEKHGENRYIATIPGRGYKFVAEVTTGSAFKVQDSKSGQETEVAELKSNEPLPSEIVSDHKAAAENQAAKSEKPATENAKPNRSRLAAAFIGLIFLGLTGFYFWRAQTPVSPAPIKTLAVLPFKPLVAENRNESLELGMADTLITKLSSGEMIVRPINSVRRYNNYEQDSLAAGRELDVEAVLDGSIQTANDRIRVSARLLRLSDGKQLWAGQFDEKFTDIFAVQDSISEKVRAALTVKLNVAEQNRLTRRDTENVEAYQLYMKGRFYHFKFNLPDTQKGIEYYNQAIAADPGYALAYAGIADAYRSFSLTSDVTAAEVMPRAKAAAMRAIELDAEVADAHTALGFILFFYDWDWAAAEQQFRRGLELDPNSADTRQAYAHLLSNTGRHSEALAEIKRARELDPLNFRTGALEGQFLLHAGQNQAAINHLQKTIDLDQTFWMTHLFAASAYAEAGMYAEAVSEGQAATKFSPAQNWSNAFGGYALAKAGRPTEARAVLDELLRLSSEKYVPPYHLALIHNGLGEPEKALDYLEKGFAEKDVRMVFLKVEPKWNNLRNEPRFIDLMRRMNF